MTTDEPSRPLLSVVVPAYDERPTIAEILRRIAGTPFDKEIVVVDDGSTDGTREYLASLADGETRLEGPDGEPVAVSVRFHDMNRGKGAALRTGFEAVRGRVVLVQDADLEYDPDDYARLLEPILEGDADVVYGSRFLGGPQRVHLFWHYVGNRGLTFLSNMLTNLNLTDMETCYKAFRREVVEEIAPTLKSDRFGFEPEVTAKVAKRGYRVYETPVSYHGRDYAEGKKIRWKDGLAALWHIVRYRVVD
ncbi:MAG: glycosyltransferase family 2 protein [Gemmatimonadetes bacterium]|nr:glycosyltransferase family 2 protein [Gemmatimonadota bacterium]